VCLSTWCNALQAFFTCPTVLVWSMAGVKEQYAKQWLQGAKWAAITIVVVGSPVLGKVTQACLCTGWEASAGEKLLVMSRWYQPARLCTPGAVAGLLCLNESPLGCHAIQTCHRLHSVECAKSVKATSMALAACLHVCSARWSSVCIYIHMICGRSAHPSQPDTGQPHLISALLDLGPSCCRLLAGGWCSRGASLAQARALPDDMVSGISTLGISVGISSPVLRRALRGAAGLGGAHAGHRGGRAHRPGRGAAGRHAGALPQRDRHGVHQCAADSSRPGSLPGLHPGACVSLHVRQCAAASARPGSLPGLHLGTIVPLHVLMTSTLLCGAAHSQPTLNERVKDIVDRCIGLKLAER